MALDILETLADLEPNYRGAVFLTYTLNLLFFEELIVPKLDAMGCTNVIILTDQHGYDEAMRRGGQHLRRAGRQYICAPVVGKGRGVQHAKAILLVGPQHGTLLVGSGNLTLQGIGRNLEQFLRFDVDMNEEETSSLLRYPFHTVWRLIDDINRKMELSSTIGDRLQAVRELAPWLEEPVKPPANLRLWHSFERPIFSQWQDRARVDDLRLLSPFWTVSTVDRMVDRFKPGKVVLGLNAEESRIDGKALEKKAKQWPCNLEIFDVLSKRADHRKLHAKTFIGSNDHASWCVSGSANCTNPGLQKSWSDGGNLELVIWQRTEDPDLFNGVWSDELIKTRQIEIDLLEGSDEDESTKVELPFRLSDLKYDNGWLFGKIEWVDMEPMPGSEWWLELKRSGEQMLVTPDSEWLISVAVEKPLEGIEAGRVIWRTAEQDDIASPFHWVDQPTELIRFGNRTYHARVEASLQTFLGAGELFEDLLNFLWERVDPRKIQEDKEDKEVRRSGRRDREEGSENGDSKADPPPVSAFFTDEELSSALYRHVEGYAPYHQSIYSLRDLISLALLRLTVETKPAESETGEGEDLEDDAGQEREKQLRKERKEVRQRLCDYVQRYCRRYATRLMDLNFVAQVSPQLLFENHFTLGRILLEFYEKEEFFTDEDLRRSLMQILGALFWPEIIGRQGKIGWQLLVSNGYKTNQLREIFQDTSLPDIIVVLIAEAWGEPKSWRETHHKEELVQEYMLGQQIIRNMVNFTGREMWEDVANNTTHSHDLFGFRNLSDLSDTSAPISIEERVSHFKLLAIYQTPAVEKYHEVLVWAEAYHKGWQNKPGVRNLQQIISNELGHEQELNLVKKAGRNGKIARIVGNEEHCPSCFIKLPLTKQQTLKKYDLVLCPSCSRAVLYWEPKLVIDTG